MPVMALEDVFTAKLLSFNEHYLDFTGVLQIARALREQVDWVALERATDGSPYARAFLTLAQELGLVSAEVAERESGDAQQGRASISPSASSTVGASSHVWSRPTARRSWVSSALAAAATGSQHASDSRASSSHSA